MRLFLSSYRFGNYAEVLQEMLGDGESVGVITNAKDYKTEEERAASVAELFESFKDIGLEPYEIDLRNYFADNQGLEEDLAALDLLWLAGGNSFVLARALKQAGAAEIIRKKVLAGELLYGGESAGAVLATPTLRGVEFGDDPYVLPDGYTDIEIWEGLSLVPFAIVPHYESDWEGYERMIEVLEEEDIPYKTLSDHQVYVVDGDEQALLV